MKSKIKIFNVSKLFTYKFLKFFYKNVFLDNDLSNQSVKQIQDDNLKRINFLFNKDDFHFFKKTNSKNYSLNQNNLEISKNFILVHYDEKWEISSYIKTFQKLEVSLILELNIILLLNFFPICQIKLIQILF